MIVGLPSLRIAFIFSCFFFSFIISEWNVWLSGSRGANNHAAPNMNQGLANKFAIFLWVYNAQFSRLRLEMYTNKTAIALLIWCASCIIFYIGVWIFLANCYLSKKSWSCIINISYSNTFSRSFTGVQEPPFFFFFFFFCYCSDLPAPLPKSLIAIQDWSLKKWPSLINYMSSFI